MDVGVSGRGLSNTGCWMSCCSCAYLETWRNLVIREIVRISCGVQAGDMWMYSVSVFVVLLDPFWLPCQNFPVFTCIVSVSIVTCCFIPVIVVSRDIIRSGAVLYCRSLILRRRMWGDL